jgi:hypothetical protein
MAFESGYAWCRLLCLTISASSIFVPDVVILGNLQGVPQGER